IQELTPKNIVDALSEEVLYLRHREELILAVLLTFCSPLRINFNRIDIRGWLNMIILGDTSTGKCIRGDSLLFTDFGMKKIKDIENFQTEKFLPIQDGLKVYGLKSPVEPTQTYKSKLAKTIKIKTKLGYVLEGTFNHPIMTLNANNELKFKMLEEIRLEDLAAIQYHQDYFPVFRDSHRMEVPDYFGAIQEFSLKDFRELSRFIGYLVGDGEVGSKGEQNYDQNRIRFTNGNKEIIRDYQRILEKFFDVKPKAIRDKRSKAISVGFGSQGVRDWLIDFGLLRVKSPEKEIPKKILSLDKANIREFLRGVFETDGFVSKRDVCIGVSSSSRKLIGELRVLLLNFGIIT
ncbi:unnamed protein product, partial [marine sediment metagenome]